ncbi:MAG: DUF6702 family protein [Gemmatimonadales bacterium]
MIGLWLVGIALGTPVGNPPIPHGRSPAGIAGPTVRVVAVHDLHASYGRVAVEAASVTIRIRMFQDDLSRALARHATRDTVDLAAKPLADSVARDYLGRKLILAADGTPLTGRLVAGGAEQDMWWYLLEYPLAKPIKRLTIASQVMFELFGDQQNLLKVAVAKTGVETALYFVPGEPGPVTLDVR